MNTWVTNSVVKTHIHELFFLLSGFSCSVCVTPWDAFKRDIAGAQFHIHLLWALNSELWPQAVLMVALDGQSLWLHPGLPCIWAPGTHVLPSLLSSRTFWGGISLWTGTGLFSLAPIYLSEWCQLPKPAVANLSDFTDHLAVLNDESIRASTCQSPSFRVGRFLWIWMMPIKRVFVIEFLPSRNILSGAQRVFSTICWKNKFKWVAPTWVLSDTILEKWLGPILSQSIHTMANWGTDPGDRPPRFKSPVYSLLSVYPLTGRTLKSLYLYFPKCKMGIRIWQPSSNSCKRIKWFHTYKVLCKTPGMH